MSPILTNGEPAEMISYNGPYLRSQYPAETENHVEYILVASFDIDRGSVMEHQYPGPISGDEHMLAELMLPDQTHMRSQDWTIFFLHKDTTAEEVAKEERRERRERRRARRRRKEAGEMSPVDDEHAEDGEDIYSDGESDLLTDESDEEPEGPPLIYVLNLVNTKQDQTVKRGAIVKAMAICTRHSFLHIYKPLLLLALEEYFRSPQLETLESLYNALNSMDLSLMPRLSHLERNILQASDAKDMFVEKFSIMIQQRMAEDNELEQNGSSESLSHSPARSKGQYSLPRDTHEFDSRVMYNGVPVPVKVPVAITPEQVGDFSLIKLISTFSGPHKESPQAFTLHPHLTTSGPMTHPIIVLINALLTQKRIIFLGHNQPSGSVAEAVLAACALASGGILKGFTRHAFPYTDLTKIDDLLKVPGFIAGVTNPAFANKPEWWDLLCDLPTGRMKISPKIETAPITEGFLYFEQQKNNYTNGHSKSSKDHSNDDAANDNVFMDAVNATIQNRLGEAAVRNRFRTWVHRFTLLAAAFEETVYGASALHIGASETDADAYGYGVLGHGLVWPDDSIRLREISANVGRVEGWRQSRSYFSLIRDLASQWERGECVRGIDLGYQIDRLRFQKLGDQHSGDIYRAITRAIEAAGTLDSSEHEYDSEDLEEDFLSPSAYLSSHPTPHLHPDSPAHRTERQYRRLKARYDVINQLLCVMPENSGGLFHLSLGLFHKDKEVRFHVMKALEYVMSHEAGRHFWVSLGRFAKVGFFRVKKEFEASKTS